MSSTYSPNLAIELIGTGDQSGNWGSTTNVNLGTLLEQAISGYTTQVMTGGTDTLTMTNGASATARNMFLELTTTGGGTLNVPANKKLYFIYNNTSSGAVLVKVSGQTGVSVPNGAKMLLVCNGTDVVVATNYMASLTLGTPLATAQGGTGGTTATGSGANVLATSPTLVTPALGTPSALVATNVTGTAVGLSAGSLTTGASAGTAWTVTQSGTKLNFAYAGVTVFSIDSSGNTIAKANVTAYGTP